MNVRLVPVVILLLVAAPGLLRADESPSLEQQLDELDRVDAELAAAQQELKASPTRPRRRELRARIDVLRAEQERLVSAIERVVGPLPPRVQTDAPTTVEKQLETQQRHQDALLERNVEQRLTNP